jgi:predicted Zn-dependent protease
MKPLSILIYFIVSYFILYSADGICEYNLATGKEELIFISSDKEVKMGESLSRQVEAKMKVDESYDNQEKVRIIGQRLAEVCDRRDIIYQFKVLSPKEESEKYNAFALPGGYIYIFKDLLERLKTDDEIAAVLAHELGHICAKHVLKRLQNSFGYEMLRFLVIKGADDNYTRYKANEAINQLMLSYSREDELEADRLAVKYLKKAGYKPEAVIKTLDELIKIQMSGPIRPKRYWYTHPYLADRKAAASKEISGRMEFDDYINTTPEEGYVVR